jgi:hypothetical protein
MNGAPQGYALTIESGAAGPSRFAAGCADGDPCVTTFPTGTVDDPALFFPPIPSSIQ